MTFTTVNQDRVDMDRDGNRADYLTTMNGAPIANPNSSQRIGNQLRGTLLLQDVNLIEMIQSLDRERIPERVVHARGCGAHGYFEVTRDMTDVTSAEFLDRVGKRTPLFARFSTTAGEKGSPETIRDTRGFAFKLYTREGNLDWAFLSQPVFSIRDGAKFPSFVHATKKNPQTGLPDHTIFWDYFNKNPEAIHFLMFLFSDRATPIDFQHADIFSVNTYRFTKTDGTSSYVKLHIKSNQGNQYLTAAEAKKRAGEDPDHMTRSLHDNIEKGKFPSWDVYGQIISPDVAENYPIDIFDPTKTLPSKDFPYRPFGRIVLNKNVGDNFAEAEQVAFSPANVVPGWALTPDPVLQLRAFAYQDAQRYRLGANFIQLPINRPKRSFNPLRRDGAANFQGSAGACPYYPSSFQHLDTAPQYAEAGEENWNGPVVDFESKLTEDDFAQPREFWERILPKDPGQQDNLVSNVAEHLALALPDVRQKTYSLFGRVHQNLGHKIRLATEQEAHLLELRKLEKKFERLSLPFQPRGTRTALDRDEALPCSLDRLAPNTGLIGRNF
ncbi:Catalase A [Cytospora mali]|uniref:Catalase A n=1 Tax=Cytospora mali TaxID=578113 RepID=A0A194VJ33_CYTMA|nr:Catalase A [Valsa mali]